MAQGAGYGKIKDFTNTSKQDQEKASQAKAQEHLLGRAAGNASQKYKGSRGVEEMEEAVTRKLKVEIRGKMPLLLERHFFERAMGIEPTYEAWEASILPLNHARF